MRLLARFPAHGYLNFDDERLTDITDYDQLIAAVNEVYDNPRHLLLDEIQNLDRWELFVNRLQRQGFQLIITGSNAHLLSGELATHLTGRHIPIVLFPFSYGEFLSSRDTRLTEYEMDEALYRYANDGGYPEPLLRDMDRGFYLTTLWDSILYKDIIRRRRIRSVAGIEDLAAYLLANVASEYSLNRLTSVTQCKSVPHGCKVHRVPGGVLPVLFTLQILFQGKRTDNGQPQDLLHRQRFCHIPYRPVYT